MFKSLTDNFSKIVKSIKGQGRFTENNIENALHDIKRALIEADVALFVITSFLEQIKTNIIGKKINDDLNPSDAFIKIIHDALVEMLGKNTSSLNLSSKPPVPILIAGLQGTGKTTTSAKLAKYLKNTLKKKVLLTSTDIYRPAAITQLETLAKELNVDCYIPPSLKTKPIKIAKAAMVEGQKLLADIVIIDTAGRLHIDNEMMEEIKEIHQAINPLETLYVLDCMVGQDAANSAKEFHEALPLTGIILTKTDGDARGGAALSVTSITNKPIKFIGTGEKLDDLDSFHPDRLASRILDQGDMLSAIEQVEKKIDQKKALDLTKKMKKGKKFDFNDLKEQLNQVQQLGDLNQFMNKMPGMSQMKLNQQDTSSTITKNMAIINSMTKKERSFPAIMNPSRKKRIANGSGTQLLDVNKLIKQLDKMQKMMKKFSKFNKAKSMFNFQ